MFEYEAKLTLTNFKVTQIDYRVLIIPHIPVVHIHPENPLMHRKLRTRVIRVRRKMKDSLCGVDSVMGGL